MLHPVNPPDCIDDMKKLLRYQRMFLLLLLKHPAPLDKSVFESFFGKELGRWSWARVYRAGKPTKKLGKHVEPLVQYASANRSDYKTVLRIIRHDHSFPARYSDPSFSFEFFTLTEEWRNVLTPFLQAFYEILHKPGYPVKQFGFTQGKLKWRSFMDAQYEANRFVCPYCDGGQGDRTEKIDGNDAEHWLPKSAYPHLSVHWANLFRVCMVCNGRFKGDDNPIKHPGCGELRKTYHPYQQPACNSVQAAVSRESVYPRQYQLSVNDSQNPLCADALDQVLSLSERWSSRINGRLNANKSAFIAEQVREAKYKKYNLTEDWVKDTLSMVMQFRRDDLGKEPNSIPQAAVLAYQASREVSSIFYALNRAHR